MTWNRLVIWKMTWFLPQLQSPQPINCSKSITSRLMDPLWTLPMKEHYKCVHVSWFGGGLEGECRKLQINIQFLISGTRAFSDYMTCLHDGAVSATNIVNSKITQLQNVAKQSAACFRAISLTIWEENLNQKIVQTPIPALSQEIMTAHSILVQLPY